MKLFAVLALAFLATVSASNSTGFVSRMNAPEGRITNGEYAHDGQIPYQVSLFINRGIMCGGSMISQNWVLTAMHCVNDAWEVRVNYGSTEYHGYRLQTTIPGNYVHKHPHYNSQTLQNDIALLNTPSIPTSGYVSPIRLPNMGHNPSYDGQWALASGWGKISDWEGTSNNLRYTWVPVISNGQCQGTYGGMIDGATLCTGTPDGRSTCSGDSGGPLVIDGVLVGVTSFVAASGCQSGLPAGFERVAVHTDWIRGVTGIAYY